VIGVVDQETGETRMYVDGVEVGTALSEAAIDWSGANASGLGRFQGNATGGFTGNPTSHGIFVGDIALFNFYQYAVDDAGALAAFQSVGVPEPHSALLLLLGCLGMLSRRTRGGRRAQVPSCPRITQSKKKPVRDFSPAFHFARRFDLTSFSSCRRQREARCRACNRRGTCHMQHM
jgi:hypothetical protein